MFFYVDLISHLGEDVSLGLIDLPKNIIDYTVNKYQAILTETKTSR